jgi:hypothetical protein
MKTSLTVDVRTSGLGGVPDLAPRMKQAAAAVRQLPRRFFFDLSLLPVLVGLVAWFAVAVAVLATFVQPELGGALHSSATGPP